MQNRLQRLKRMLRASRLSAALITKRENVFYLSGFRGEGALLVTAAGQSWLITDARFAGQARDELKNFEIAQLDGSWTNVLKNLAKKAGIKRLGFEASHLAFDEHKKLASALKRTRLIPKKGLVEDMRILKDASELALLKKAISITRKAYFYIKDIISPGMTEKDLAVKIDNFLRSHGAERSAFPTIAASGVNSSYPHAATTKKALGKKGPILIDFGCVYKWYHSDLTRMFFLGKISSKSRHIYGIIKAAQEKAIRKIKPGVKISDIDKVARQYIAAEGLGKNFLHGLGHGIGLEIHEGPRIWKKNNQLLKAGMVFTVEPGVYIPGWGGVRVEDMVLVTNTGCEILTKSIPKS